MNIPLKPVFPSHVSSGGWGDIFGVENCSSGWQASSAPASNTVAFIALDAGSEDVDPTLAIWDLASDDDA